MHIKIDKYKVIVIYGLNKSIKDINNMFLEANLEEDKKTVEEKEDYFTITYTPSFAERYYNSYIYLLYSDNVYKSLKIKRLKIIYLLWNKKVFVNRREFKTEEERR